MSAEKRLTVGLGRSFKWSGKDGLPTLKVPEEDGNHRGNTTFEKEVRTCSGDEAISEPRS